MEEWSNNAALGYALLAANQIGYSEDEKKILVRTMYRIFDEKSVDEAKDIYNKSPY